MHNLLHKGLHDFEGDMYQFTLDLSEELLTNQKDIKTLNLFDNILKMFWIPFNFKHQQENLT